MKTSRAYVTKGTSDGYFSARLENVELAPWILPFEQNNLASKREIPLKVLRFAFLE